jgi:hypothetical protein
VGTSATRSEGDVMIKSMTPRASVIKGRSCQELFELARTLEEEQIKIIRLLELTAYKIWDAILTGNQCEKVRGIYMDMQNPQPGDLVIETSTLSCGKMRNAQEKQVIPRGIHGIGYLIKITYEPCMTEEEWDSPGEPVPTEKVIYMKLFNGQEMRWVNAEVLKVPIKELAL